MPAHKIQLHLRRFAVACLVVTGVFASEHHGTVKSGVLPIPGATVTATQGDKKLLTTTDDKGVYAFADLADGVWTIQVEMLGFAKQSRDIGIAVDAPSPEWDLKLLTQADLTAAVAAAKAPPPAPPAPSQAAAPPTPLAATTAATTSPAAAAPAAPAPPRRRPPRQRKRSRRRGGHPGSGHASGGEQCATARQRPEQREPGRAGERARGRHGSGFVPTGWREPIGGRFGFRAGGRA